MGNEVALETQVERTHRYVERIDRSRGWRSIDRIQIS